MKKIIALNWKETFQKPSAPIINGKTEDNQGELKGAQELLKTVQDVAHIHPDYEWIVFPGDEIVTDLVAPLPRSRPIDTGWMSEGQEVFGGIEFGYQNLSPKKNSLPYSLIGHMSQRIKGLTNEKIAQKMEAISNTDNVPFLCVGPIHETDSIEMVIREQLTVLESWSPVKPLVIAYEPGFAIGNGKAMTLEDIEICYEILLFSLERFPVKRIIYGGSVNDNNISQILEITDGVIIGTASQKSSTLLAMAIALGQSY